MALIADTSELGRTEETLDPEEAKVYIAPPILLMWWRFRRHKLAMIASVVLILLYVVAIFADFFAPYDPNHYDGRFTYSPPTRIHFSDETGFHLRPFIYASKLEFGEAFERIYREDKSKRIYLSLFVQSDPYKFLGQNMKLHLLGLETGDMGLFLFGADRLGRDQFSRAIYGSRISLSIGLVGVFLTMIFGVLIGGVSGYYGGVVDIIVQRVIEFIRSIPDIPLWMTLAAALPAKWPPLRIYFGITVVLSFIGWTGLARVVRGWFLSLRESDFVLAAKLSGASEMRIILRHMVPSFMSYLIASLTLSVPGMILGETSLSFLGIGLRPPVVSWGVLLKEVQALHVVALAPWLLIPGIFVIIASLCFNFVGDGLRDAADPYSR